MQTEIDFTQAGLRRQNNRDSELQIIKGVNHFAGQAKKVLEYLQQGKRITSKIAMNELDIVDVRPRIATLIDMGYNIGFDVIKGSHGSKEWYLR